MSASDTAGQQGSAGAASTTPQGQRSLPHDGRFVKQAGGWTLCERADMSADTRAALLALVAEYDVPTDGIFARSLRDLSGYKGSCPPVEINLTHDRAIYEHPRPHSLGEYRIMDDKCGQLAEAAIIERATNAPNCQYAMNSTMPAKKDTEGNFTDARFCADARRLNAATIPDHYKIPLPEDLFQQTGEATFFSKCDCRAAFNQLPLRASDRHKTAFWWRRDLWQYVRLLYGLRNATSAFQRVMDSHIREFGLQDFVLCYVDDLLVFSNNAEEHVEHLGRLFAMLRAIGIKLHPEKTLLAADGVEFLGHMISAKGLQPTQARIAAFMAIQPPRSLVACQRLLGMIGYYRCYIDHYAAKMAAITRLTTKATVWGAGTWGEEQQAALDAIKLEFVEGGRILRRFDPDKQIIVHTDFSEDGISGVMGQLDELSQEYMVACVSRTLNVHERRYGSYKGELLAVVWAVGCFRPYLHGLPFKIVTDHGPLEWLMSQADLAGQPARWALSLQEYDLAVVHRPGLLNQNADALSRAPVQDSHDTTGARLDEDSDTMRPPPAQVVYPGVGFPYYATAPPNRISERVSAANGLRPALVLCSIVEGAWQSAWSPWHLASQRQLLALHTVQSADDHSACVLSARELLAGHVGAISDHADQPRVRPDPAIVGATAAVSAHRSALRALQPSPRLPLRLSSGGRLAGISTFLRQHAFFSAAADSGVGVLEAPGGLGAGLQACLQLGIKVARYVNLEPQPAVRDAIRRLIARLQQAHPEHLRLANSGTTALPPAHSAGGGAYDITNPDLAPLFSGQQWLVVGSWGLQPSWGQDQMLSLLGGLQRLMQERKCPPPTYLLQGPHTTQQAQEIEGQPFGVPVPLDLVQMGVARHTACAVYSNLATAEHLACIVKRMRPAADRSLERLLEPGRLPAVATCLQPPPFVPVHVPGSRLVVLPEVLTEPPVVPSPGAPQCFPTMQEWERILGHGASVAAGLPDALALTTLCSAVTPPLVAAILASALALQRHYVTPHDTHTPPPRWLPAADSMPLGGSDDPDAGLEGLESHMARNLMQRQLGSDLVISFTTLLAATAEAQETAGDPDVWEDAPVMALLQQSGTAAGGTADGTVARRVKRRAASYRWDGTQLLRLMVNGASRVCPPPAARRGIVTATHSRLGHLGIRRTFALLQLGHWWHNMRAQVETVLRECAVCDLSNARGTMRPAQLYPLEIKGLFYRWGVDLAGPLAKTSDGYQYCMIAIEHFSKHIEVIPLLDKTADRVAAAFADVLARFGAPAEVLTDNGGEFAGEFAALLERCFIDPRHTSPNHPQADGAAERIVKVVKESLRKACYEAADPTAWIKQLPELLLGYRCSPQASTRYSPYELLYGGVRPVVPPAVRERLESPIDFDDIAAAADSLLARADWVRQAYPAAASNLLVAQHRDTLRYSAVRTGRYLAKPVVHKPGDYVYVRRGSVTNTLQFPQYDNILRVESVGPLGVAVLIGRDGARVRRRVEQLLPCHLEVDPIVDPRLFRPSRDLQCEVCGSPHDEARMLLCDHCNTGWHLSCLTPPLSVAPPGAWSCPHCQRLRQEEQGAPPQAAPQPVEPCIGKVLFPRAATRRLDLEAEGLHGQRVQQLESGGRRGPVVVRHGTLRFRGAIARPRYFLVQWSTGEEEELTLTRAKRMLVGS